MSGQAPGFHKFKIGDFEVIALHEGTLVRDLPAGFVPNATDAEVGEAYATAGMPRDKLTLTFTALAVKSSKGVVLLDTGFGDSGPPTTGTLVPNLKAAGIEPKDVGTVVISHFHGDHIMGLRSKDGALIYPNAEICAPEVEWDYWMNEANASSAGDGLKGNFDLCQKTFGPIAKDVRRYAWGSEVMPGLTSVRANGHTPGMSAITIASGSEAMMFVADITNNPLVFARNPDWQAAFDMDRLETIATRRRILDQAVADKLRLSFFHAPFPATGFIAKSGTGYEFLPALWSAA